MPTLDPRIPSGIAPPTGPTDLPAHVAGQPSPTLPAAVQRQAAAIRAATATPTEDGGMMLQLDGPEAGVPLAEGPIGDNLAAGMDEADLKRLATDVLEGIEADEESNAGYFDAMKQGIALLGLEVEAADDPFEGASGAIHPLMLEALVRFVSNARGEMQPADGPAKVKTEATPDAMVRDKAARKTKWLNYYLTVEDEGFYPDCDAGWLWLGLYGSIFRKVYDDPITGMPKSRYLTPLQLLVSFHAPDLESAHRATHVDIISTAEAMARVASGFYIDTEFQDTAIEAETQAQEQKIALEKRTPSDREEDAEQVHMHSHVLVDPERYAMPIPEGAPEGLPLPYVVTVDRRTEKVLRITEDWDAKRPHFRRRETYAHYLMHPGLGFYGWGLIALMAGCTNTASTLWRQAINTFMLHTHPGGLRTRGVKPETENLTVGPGEFAEIDTGGLPIAQAVMPLPYRDIPPSFAPLFESVVMAGKSLGGTQELQIGEGRQNAPVGTTLALLEAAVKPTAAMFKRMHAAQGKELRMIAARFGRNPKARYPYLVDGQRGVAVAADFADVADVVPVSDPNIPTQTQRIANAQAVLMLAQASGGIMDVRAAYEDMLATMGRSAQEIARLMPQPGQGQPADVATEFAFALKGMPLAVGPEQDHQAHIMAHLPLLSADLPPNVQSALMAHIGDHAAAWYRLQAEMAALQAGIPMPPPGQPMPPQIEGAVARAVAQVSDSIMQKLGGMLGAGVDPAKQAELAYKREELAYKREDSRRMAETTARQDQTELLKMRQASLDAAADRELKEKELDAKIRGEVIKAVTSTGQAHMKAAQATAAADQKHAQAIEAGGHQQMHQAAMEDGKRRHASEMEAGKQQHAFRMGEAERQHAGIQSQADRAHQQGIAAMGHVASALDREATASHAAAEAAAGRQHEAGMAAADRQHQTGIAAMGHQAGMAKQQLVGKQAVEKQKLAGDTALKAAKMRGAAKPPAKAKTKAKAKK